MSAQQPPTNLGASVRARLLALARGRKTEFQLVLSEFAVERLLYRLGISSHSDRFVLKGAMLFKLWSDDLHRATWDLDLLGRGANTVADVVAVIRDLCGIDVADGITFDLDTLTGEEIRAAEEYAGARVRLDAQLAGARIPVQVDVGFGDTIVPAPVWETYPTLLAHEPPRILVYPRETVVAEKLEAMVTLGVTNSRMKDFYDVYLLCSSFPFDGSLLAEAVRATFERRGPTLRESRPLALTHGFLAAPERQILWRAFLRRGRLDAQPDTAQLAEMLQQFLGPILAAVVGGEPFLGRWPAGGPWEATR